MTPFIVRIDVITVTLLFGAEQSVICQDEDQILEDQLADEFNSKFSKNPVPNVSRNLMTENCDFSNDPGEKTRTRSQDCVDNSDTNGSKNVYNIAPANIQNHRNIESNFESFHSSYRGIKSKELLEFTNGALALWIYCDNEQTCFIELQQGGPIRQPEFIIRQNSNLHLELYHCLPGGIPSRRFLLGEADIPIAQVMVPGEHIVDVRQFLTTRLTSNKNPNFNETPRYESNCVDEFFSQGLFGAKIFLRFEHFDKRSHRPISLQSSPSIQENIANVPYSSFGIGNSLSKKSNSYQVDKQFDIIQSRPGTPENEILGHLPRCRSNFDRGSSYTGMHPFHSTNSFRNLNSFKSVDEFGALTSLTEYVDVPFVPKSNANQQSETYGENLEPREPTESFADKNLNHFDTNFSDGSFKSCDPGDLYSSNIINSRSTSPVSFMSILSTIESLNSGEEYLQESSISQMTSSTSTSIRTVGPRQIDFAKKFNLTQSPITLVQKVIRAASASASKSEVFLMNGNLSVASNVLSSPSFYSSITTGIIALEIVAASNLPREKRFMRVHYKNNPFVVVSFGKQSFRTTIIRRTLDPVWRERCYFALREGETGFHLAFSVYDYKRLSYNACIGSASLRAETLLATPNEVQKIVLTLRVGNNNISSPELTDSVLFIKGVFITHDIMRRNFWESLAEQYDNNDDGCLNRLEITAMLESLGSTLSNQTIDNLLAKNSRGQVDLLNSSSRKNYELSSSDESEKTAHSKNTLRENEIINEDIIPITSGTIFPPTREFSISEIVNALEELTVSPANHRPYNISDSIRRVFNFSSSSNTSQLDDISSQNELSHIVDDERSVDLKFEENIVHIGRCPTCSKNFSEISSLSGDLEIITHLSICATKDRGLADRFVMGGFLTEDYASRNWLVRLVSFLTFGGYRIGKNNGNILVQDRRTGKLQEERMPTYIRLGIRWMHQRVIPGLAVDNTLVRQLFHSLTIKQGRKFDDPGSAREIRGFIRYHNIGMDDVLRPVDEFRSFNEFFYRELRPGARYLDSYAGSPTVCVSPADCRLNVFCTIEMATRLWIKGSLFTLARLLRDETLAKYFAGGSLAICRLAPQDYHRFHSPVDGTIVSIYEVPGAYFTVNPMAVRQTAIDVFCENRRTVIIIESDFFGTIAYVAVGAMMVGSIVITAALGSRLQRLDEIGYFAFGGSTIILIFPSPGGCEEGFSRPQGKLLFDSDLVENSTQQLETLVQVGNSLGRLI